jgi:hypothetical protein
MQVAAPAPAPNLASRSITDAIPEAPAAGEEEVKADDSIVEESKAGESPLKRADTDFDREDSVEKGIDGNEAEDKL